MSSATAAKASVRAALDRSVFFALESLRVLAACVRVFLLGFFAGVWESALAAAFFSVLLALRAATVFPAPVAALLLVLPDVPFLPGACDRALAAAALDDPDLPFFVALAAAEAALGFVLFCVAMCVSTLLSPPGVRPWCSAYPNHR